MATRIARIERTDRAELTPIGAGTGRYRARLARTGVQLYGDVAEYRDASEVFAAESIATLLNLRVQVGHVPNPGTAVGKVAMPFRRVDLDGESYLEAELEIGDTSTRERIDRGELGPISMGYTAELESAPGVTSDGKRFTLRQRNIRFDHVALLDARTELARCGEHCRVHLDQLSQERPSSVSSCSCTVQTDSFPYPHPRFPGKSRAYVEAYLAAEARSAAERADGERGKSDAARAQHGAPGGLSVEVPDSFFVGTDLHMRSDAVASELRRMLGFTVRPSQAEIENALQSIRLAAIARADASGDEGASFGEGRVDADRVGGDDDASFSAQLARRANRLYGADR